MKLDRKQDLNVLYQVCVFQVDREKNGRPGLWLAETFSTSLKPLNRIKRNLTGSKISTFSTKFVYFWPIGKTKSPSWPLIGRDIFDFSSETAERNSTKVNWKQDLNIHYLVCVFQPDRKNKINEMANPVSHWLRLFHFSSETTERNSTKVDRKQDLNVLFQVCVFGRWPPWSICRKGSRLYSGARLINKLKTWRPCTFEVISWSLNMTEVTKFWL